MLQNSHGILVTLATLDSAGRPTWHGVWVAGGTVRRLGPPPASGARGEGPVAPATGALLELVGAASRSYSERLEQLGTSLDSLEARADPPPIVEISAMGRDLAGARKHVARLSVLVTELGGPLGERFPAPAGLWEPVRSEVVRLEGLAAGLSQGARDLTAIRNAVESNRLAEAANELGRASNRIAALANTSNLRMLGVAYVALVLALVSVVVLIPNTAATILGMPSAAWVPGVWVDAVLVALAVVPLVVVFSRSWIRRMLRGWSTYEGRTSEGLADLPEVDPDAAAAGRRAKSLIPKAP